MTTFITWQLLVAGGAVTAVIALAAFVFGRAWEYARHSWRQQRSLEQIRRLLLPIKWAIANDQELDTAHHQRLAEGLTRLDRIARKGSLE